MSETVASGRLGQNIKVLSGFAFSSAGFSQTEGLPLVRIRDLARAETEMKFRGQYDPTYLIKRGDILIGMDGDFEVHRWSGEDALLNQRVCKVETATRQLDQDFLYWYLKPRVSEIQRRTPQTTVRHLSASDLYLVPQPPIGPAEQSTVAQVLDTLNTTIHETEAIIAKLKAIKQGLLHDLLTRGIEATGELRPTQAEAPHLYKESQLGWMPKEWQVLKVHQLGEVVTGGTPPSHDPYAWGSKIPFITPGDITEDGPTINTERSLSERGKRYVRLLPSGSLLVVCIGSTIGKVGTTSTQSCTNQQINAIIPHDSVDGTFLFYALKLNIDQLRRLAGLQAVPIVNKSSFETIYLPCPPHAEQIEISNRVQAISARIQSEALQLEKFRKQRVGLMDDLLSGRVRVTSTLFNIGQGST